jgi:hypothetical protein
MCGPPAEAPGAQSALRDEERCGGAGCAGRGGEHRSAWDGERGTCGLTTADNIVASCRHTPAGGWPVPYRRPVGAWGPGIFSDDLALDVCDEWRAAILDGAAPDQATRSLVERYSRAAVGPDYATVFWTALAAAQMETGRLQADVRDRALAIIDAGADLDLWAESGNRGGRERVLRRLAARLRGPQPPPKNLRRARPRDDDEAWERERQAMIARAEQVWPAIRDSPECQELTARLREAGIDPGDERAADSATHD